MPTVRATTVYLGLGSNVGDRDAQLQQALQRLRAVPGVEVVRVSKVRETAFVGDGPVQGPFKNAVAEVRTTLPARALLGVLKAIEQQAGRSPGGPRNQPRTLDLDILFYGDEVIDTRELVVPHPRWHEREFVLEPLRELGVDTKARARAPGPVVIEPPAALSAAVATWRAGGCTIGLVPTMGSLHEGHVSLMRAARRECDRVVATIFVNPLQFGPKEDFAAYPRDLEKDLQHCARAGVDAVFAPTVAQMYEPGFCSNVDVGAEAQGMEGALRPGHFRGVATVVARLFAIALPHRAYFGEKDAQQLAVITRMTRDLGFPIQIVRCAIVREPDGLAMSSRNVFLEAGDRKASTVIYRALCHARELFARGTHDRDTLLQRAREVLASEPRAEVDYVELRREGDLQPLPGGTVDGGRLLVAARFSRGSRPVRLLDNMSLAHVEAS
jgi:pantoate--beta-alanine ligase